MNMNDKIANISEMIKQLVLLEKDIPIGTELYRDYGRFLMLVKAQVSLINILERVQKHIDNTKLSKNTTANGLTSKATQNFWVKVKDIIMDTYNKNKES